MSPRCSVDSVLVIWHHHGAACCLFDVVDHCYAAVMGAGIDEATKDDTRELMQQIVKRVKKRVLCYNNMLISHAITNLIALMWVHYCVAM